MADSTVRIVIVGDSIVQGTHYNFRDLLWNMLLDSGYTDIDFVGNSTWGEYFGNFDWDHAGWGGKKTNQIIDLLAPALPTLKPDIAVLHTGTNDRWENPPDTPENVAAEVEDLIARMRAVNPDVAVFIGQFHHSDESYGGKLRAAYADLAQRIGTARSPVETVDLFTGWNPDTRRKNQTYTGDPIGRDFDTQDHDLTHPNLYGAHKIAERFFEAMITLPRLVRYPDRMRIDTHADPVSVAHGKTVTSDVDNPPYDASRAVDGDLFTSWVAPDKDAGHWLQVDLGQPYDIKGTAIYWQCNGMPYGYTIEVSPDGTSWETMVDKSCNKTELAIALRGMYDLFDATGIRYVKLNKLDIRNAQVEYSGGHVGIAEFKVFTETPAIDPRSVSSPDSVRNWMRFNKICEGVEPDTGGDPADTPTVAGNLIANGDFSSGDAGWTFLALSPAEGSKSITGGRCNVSVVTPDAFWKVQLYQGELSLVNGRTYTVTFDALSDEAGKEISVDINVEGGEGGYWKTLTLTTSMSTYGESFVYEGQTTTGGRLKFHLGKSAGDVVFDKVSLVEGGSASVNRPGRLRPAADGVRLVTAGGALSRIVVAPDVKGVLTCRLFDCRGREVVRRTGRAGETVIDEASLARLPAGTYLVHTFHDGNARTHRIVAGRR